MFERVSRAAERAATGTSRRAFLGRLGRGALAAAGALGGVLALPDTAEAGGKCCCGYNPYLEQGYCYHPGKGGGCNQQVGEHRCNCKPGCS